MGGYSYHFQTGAIASLTRNLGSSFATAFDHQFLDAQSNTVKELRFSPEIVSETFQASHAPIAAPTMNEWGAMSLGLLLGAVSIHYLKKRRLAR
jgi:hypothetical protein